MSLQYPEFKGKRALITGGTQGIGKAIAERLARQGATVYLNYVRNVQAAREALDQFRAAGYACELLQADLGSAEAVDAMLEQIHHFMRGAALALIEHGIRLAQVTNPKAFASARKLFNTRSAAVKEPDLK
ncbi:MAG TPA: SDR family NAD(P)-dependent oxidoreductase [Chthoniobacterales bacterium]|nr:SDR family NAD(P)-dependent oxidoreductase [Chthoniobacterales bacterium]